ncbi:hypothetical protein NIES21_14660 [Anabaenopsis circularis NIES-21]|uniref:Uncharacterized protein n=1 Tax=Anabaenopsis circularis NIES-21 TaxID=1085406 RepID=A0A1Z4GE94_9CYAN|nr:hypothetical protein NIES21_14660 [Anabaenopsis circularis NIES-21]
MNHCKQCPFFKQSQNISRIGFCQHWQEQVRGCDCACSVGVEAIREIKQLAVA